MNIQEGKQNSFIFYSIFSLLFSYHLELIQGMLQNEMKMQYKSNDTQFWIGEKKYLLLLFYLRNEAFSFSSYQLKTSRDLKSVWNYIVSFFFPTGGMQPVHCSEMLRYVWEHDWHLCLDSGLCSLSGILSLAFISSRGSSFSIAPEAKFCELF